MRLGDNVRLFGGALLAGVGAAALTGFLILCAQPAAGGTLDNPKQPTPLERVARELDDVAGPIERWQGPLSGRQGIEERRGGLTGQGGLDGAGGISNRRGGLDGAGGISNRRGGLTGKAGAISQRRGRLTGRGGL